MSEVVGDEYGDDKPKSKRPPDPEQERAAIREHQGPGEGPNDAPATTGTHRGWGDPDPGEKKAD